MLGQKGLAIYQPGGGEQTRMHSAQWTSKLPQAQLMVLYFFTHSLFLKVYRPLLRHWATITKLVFYWVTVQTAGIIFLWRCSQNMSNAVLVILLRKIRREVLFPVVQILVHYQAVVQGFCFYLGSALPYCTNRWVLELLVLLKQITSPAISSPAHQSHHSVTSFLQGNNKKPQTALRLVVQQTVILLFLGVFDGVQEAFRLSTLAVKYELTQLFSYLGPTCHSACKENISDDIITSILPLASTPLCHRFKGPATLSFSDIPPTIAVLKFVVAPEHMIRGPGKYGLDATDIPLHARFQNIRMKNASSAKGTSATVKQMKKACVVFIALYLSMLSMVIKAIR